MKSTELRGSFLKYFEDNGHQRVASASLVPFNDPTLFFVNAGMVPFKDVFLGSDIRAYNRAASSQKCMRVSGKHNDLENVGNTSRHHTFFEMLGNFSFGDYFKKEAIAYGWEFLTKVIGLPKENLYITIFDDDNQAGKLWKKHVDKNRIFRMDEKDNFWSMGPTGPCGPCSEIHIDRAPTGSVKAGDFETDRFMEIWNLVFMQFNRGDDGTLNKLAKPSIDTGMGLERLAAIVQETPGNYETDLFMPVISELENICGIKYGSNYGQGAGTDMSMRVIADHIRAMVFLIGDGVQPSNEGRGYVLRRILRRAARHGKMLKINDAFFTPLAHIIIDMMGPSYPELIQHKEFIEKVISNEEERFNETLEKGLELLDSSFNALKKKGITVLPGDEVFKLYDTFGFPKDLTEDIAIDAGFKIDNDGFEKFMNAQRERARGAWKGSGEEAISGIYKDLSKKGITGAFKGYEGLSSDSKILSIIKDGKEIKTAKAGDNISFIVDLTPFYGASGGQVGDVGTAVSEGIEITITDTTRPLPEIMVHQGVIKKGEIKVGERLTLAVDAERRLDISKNHTATHILHRALREVLGEHVKQAGSYVDNDRLRFDFSHFTGLTDAEISEVEADANRIVRQNLDVVTEELAQDEAVARGALAFFGDKYGDKVRMLSVGDYSRELCGGTHIKMTGEIGIIKIVSEGSVAAGVRRIEAVTGRGAEEYVKGLEDERNTLARLLKVSAVELPSKIEKLLSENKKLQKELETARAKMFSGKTDDETELEKIGEVGLISKFIDGADPKELRGLADNLKAKVGSGVVMLVTDDGSKTSLLIAVTKDVEKIFSAGDLMKKVVAAIGGTGGGRPDMAQGGAGKTGQFEILKSELKKALS